MVQAFEASLASPNVADPCLQTKDHQLLGGKRRVCRAGTMHRSIVYFVEAINKVNLFLSGCVHAKLTAELNQHILVPMGEVW